MFIVKNLRTNYYLLKVQDTVSFIADPTEATIIKTEADLIDIKLYLPPGLWEVIRLL